MPIDQFPGLSSEELGVAIKAYMAEMCPSCGAEKEKLTDPFCDPCFIQLPVELQARIADRAHFIETFHPAMAHLGTAAARADVNEKTKRKSKGE